VEEHQRILIAMRNNQADLAETEVRAHLLSVLSDLEHQDFGELISLISEKSQNETAGLGLD
jgi:hypothetical protein